MKLIWWACDITTQVQSLTTNFSGRWELERLAMCAHCEWAEPQPCLFSDFPFSYPAFLSALPCWFWEWPDCGDSRLFMMQYPCTRWLLRHKISPNLLFIIILLSHYYYFAKSYGHPNYHWFSFVIVHYKTPKSSCGRKGRVFFQSICTQTQYFIAIVCVWILFFFFSFSGNNRKSRWGEITF